MQIFIINHYTFGTDDMVKTQSYVKANSKQEAIDIFNTIVKKT